MCLINTNVYTFLAKRDDSGEILINLFANIKDQTMLIAKIW